mgnify:CR=1 FL=1
MNKFTIQPHGRLNDWVADEKGYFAEEGLDYFLNVEASYKTVEMLPEAKSKSLIKKVSRSQLESRAVLSLNDHCRRAVSRPCGVIKHDLKRVI